MRGVISAVVVVCLFGPVTTAVAQGGYSGAVSLVRSHGEGIDQNDTVYFLNSIDVTLGRIRATAMLPVLSQKTVWSTAPGLTPQPSTWSGTVGDPMVRADVAVAGRHQGPWSVSLNSAVKIPVADAETGLGSGEFDSAYGVTFAGSRGRSSYLIDVSYWVLGDPADVEYRDVPALYVGYATILGNGYRWSAMAGLAGSGSVAPGLDPPVQFNVGILRALRSRVAIGATVGIGLTDTAADWTAGVSWRVGF